MPILSPKIIRSPSWISEENRLWVEVMRLATIPFCVLRPRMQPIGRIVDGKRPYAPQAHRPTRGRIGVPIARVHRKNYYKEKIG